MITGNAPIFDKDSNFLLTAMPILQKNIMFARGTTNINQVPLLINIKLLDQYPYYKITSRTH